MNERMESLARRQRASNEIRDKIDELVLRALSFIDFLPPERIAERSGVGLMACQLALHRLHERGEVERAPISAGWAWRLAAVAQAGRT